MIIKQIFTLLLIISFGTNSCFSQQSWFTEIDTGLVESQYTGKKVLLEFGAVINEFALFIPDETWNEDSVQYYVYQYIPISILLQDRDPRARKYNVDFTPTLLILTPEEHELFRNEGLLDAGQIAEILKFHLEQTSKLEQLFQVYGTEPSILGDLQFVEEYIYLHSLAPQTLRDFYLKRSKLLLDALNRNRRYLDSAQKERLKLIEDFREILYISNNRSIQRLKKQKVENLDKRNQALFCYYLYRLNSSLGSFDEAVQVARTLESLVGEAPQAANYLARVRASN